jgi:hypothetical protein
MFVAGVQRIGRIRLDRAVRFLTPCSSAPAPDELAGAMRPLRRPKQRDLNLSLSLPLANRI